ncbi:MAG: hypothetical protein Q8J78_12145, partial [Moraxellaceae bacterium]|nr:hypothetical protein [Moraxellaceae bacterium]
PHSWGEGARRGGDVLMSVVVRACFAPHPNPLPASGERESYRPGLRLFSGCAACSGLMAYRSGDGQ